MNKKYIELITTRRNEYKNYAPAYCGTIRAYVFFNADGFNHLRFHTDGSPRKQDEQMYKLGLLPLVISAIISATDVSCWKKKEERQKNNERDRILGNYCNCWSSKCQIKSYLAENRHRKYTFLERNEIRAKPKTPLIIEGFWCVRFRLWNSLSERGFRPRTHSKL